MGKEIPVRKFFFSLTLVVCAAGFASDATAQYYQQQAQQATAAMPGRYAHASQAHYAPAQRGYGVQPATVAMRPGTTTYAAAPVSSGFKPVNPPSAATQRVLMASRTQPTPAPAAGVSGGGARPSVPAAAPQQYWNSSVNSLPWDQSNGAAYGASAPGGMQGTPAPQADPNMSSYGGQPGGFSGGGGECCNNGGACNTGHCGIPCGIPCGIGCCCLSSACGCIGQCCCGLGNHCLLRSTGDLVQHMPHFGTTHGYYYFRPYHVMHVFSQQELATRWNGDPRNPYDNTMFQNVYQQLGVDAATVKARAEADAKAAAAAKANGTTTQEYVVPTPVPNYPGMPQYVPGQDGVPQGMMPQGAMPQGMMPQGPIPQGSVPVPMPNPAVEYVPNR
ncbi:MAG: hypothetical protein C0483_15370 [Pirellula sp.]|nr:hypothetical protein [Pirellula sp.]